MKSKEETIAKIISDNITDFDGMCGNKVLNSIYDGMKSEDILEALFNDGYFKDVDVEDIDADQVIRLVQYNLNII